MCQPMLELCIRSLSLAVLQHQRFSTVRDSAADSFILSPLMWMTHYLCIIPPMPLRTQSNETFPASWSPTLVVALLLFIPLAGLARTDDRATPPSRIRFTSGAISAQVRGRFTPLNERVRYVIKARKGDHMVVNIIPVTPGLTMAGTVRSPSGQGDGGPGGIITNSDLDESGDYVVEASQHTMGSNYKSGSFILEVVITPASWKR